MKEIEAKLRVGMTKNGISPEAQEQIILSITSFALYGFPESHAASFALLAYASAYLKCHYLAAFTAAMLNNQPMGFYAPAILLNDARRHGLRVRPIDVVHSDWLCTLEGAKADLGLGTKPDLGFGIWDLASTVDFSRLGVDNSAPNPQSLTPAPYPTAAKSQIPNPKSAVLRLGLMYVKGLRAEAGQ